MRRLPQNLAPRLAPGSPPHCGPNYVHYAFKVWAIYEAFMRGHMSVLYFDSSANAIRSLEPLWARLTRDGHVLVRDTNALGKWSSDHSLQTFGITRDQAMDINLMCGTCWGLDFTNERSRMFFERLKSYAIPEHFNGTHVSSLFSPHPRPGTEGASVSTDERVWGHRSDEVYMSLLANELGMETNFGVEFIGGTGSVTEEACVRSGYDLPRPDVAPPKNALGYHDYENTLDTDA